MRVGNFARHHMRNHHDDLAIPSEMAFHACLGASNLAFDQPVQGLLVSLRYVLEAQESPAMRVVGMGVESQTYSFP